MKKALFISTFLLVVFSCRKSTEKPSWDTDILAPILKTSLYIDNLITDSLLVTNPDSSLTIVYNQDFYSLNTLVQIPDTVIDTVYFNPFIPPLNLSPGQFFVNPINNQQNFSVPNGVQLTRAIIRSGKMTVFVRNRVNELIRVRYKIPSATSSLGIPFDEIFDVPKRVGPTCSAPSTFSKTFDLKDYVLDLTGLTGTGFNAIVTNVSAQINPSATANVDVYTCDSIYISNSFIDMIPEYAKGYFGQSTFSVSDTTPFGLFSHVIGGTLGLEDVDINLTLENGIGADARATIGSLVSMNTRTGTNIALSHPVIGTPININRAVDNSGVVTPSYYTVALNPGNSNIKQMIENLPDKISYDVDLQINPLGNVSGGNDFIYYTPGFKASLDMTIPLSLIANDLTLADTVDISVSRDDVQGVNYGTLFLYADNGFPFDASVNVYMMDANSIVIDELIGSVNTIDEAPVDASLRVVTKRMTKLVIPVSAEKLDKLFDSTKKLKIVTKFNTSAKPNYIKIYSDYAIDFQLVGDFNYTVELK